MNIEQFLEYYEEGVRKTVDELRIILKSALPQITELLDVSAKMIAYTYGPRYADMICAVFPSKAGVKLSFYRGIDLPDTKGLLKGSAKTTRYLEFYKTDVIDVKMIEIFLKQALTLYLERTKN